MRWQALLLSFALLGLGAHANATEVEGINFADRITLGDSELVLNGAGVRVKMLFKVYALGLYLPQKSSTAGQVLASKGPRRIQIITLRTLTAEQLAEALVEFMRKNQGVAELAALQPRIDTLRSTMMSIGKVPAKTRIRLDYLPASGTRVFVDDEQKGADIPGEDFYLGLLRIWLGEHVPQASLREALLGNKE